jgi:hypothetical protein
LSLFRVPRTKTTRKRRRRDDDDVASRAAAAALLLLRRRSAAIAYPKLAQPHKSQVTRPSDNDDVENDVDDAATSTTTTARKGRGD